MTRLLLFSALFLSTFTLSAQTLDSVKVKHIHQLLDLTGQGKLGIQVMNNLFASYKKSFPNAPTDFWDEFSKGVDGETLISLIIPIYDRNFSDDDIKQMIAYYQTPIGKKLIEKMPVIMQEAMQIGGEWGKELSEKVLEKLKEKGYSKNL